MGHINVKGGYKDIVKRWVVGVISSMRSLPKRSDVTPDKPRPEEGKKGVDL